MTQPLFSDSFAHASVSTQAQQAQAEHKRRGGLWHTTHHLPILYVIDFDQSSASTNSDRFYAAGKLHTKEAVIARGAAKRAIRNARKGL